MQNYLFILFFHSVVPTLPPTTTPDPSKTTTPGPTTIATTTTTTTTTHAPGTGFCNGKPDGLYAHEEDRNKFYMCAGGTTHIQACGGGTVFDIGCKCCAWP